MFKNNRITRTLCAVMLAGAMLFPAGLSHPVSAAQDADVYSLDIEFGSLSFYYDYGTWNVNTMRYEADDNSADPANGTTLGFPGWYGFDGTANRIALKNGSVNGEAITVSLSYSNLTGANAVSGVSMSVPKWTDNGGIYTASVPAPLMGSSEESIVEAFIHLSGEPVMNSGAYESAILQPIGMLVVKIESPM